MNKSILAFGYSVIVSGFGKFCVKEKNERKGRNPSISREMMFPARRVVTFKCSRKLWEKVNGNLIGMLLVRLDADIHG